MVSAQITGTGTNLFPGVNSANVKSKSSDSALDFGAVMSAHTQKGEQDFSKIKTDVKSTENDIKSAKTQTNQDSQVKNDKVNKPVDKENTKVDQKPEIKEEVSKITEAIEDKLKEKLGLSDEELEQLLTQLGMNIADLTDNANLTKFVAEAMGEEDGFSLLTNQDFMENLNDLSAFIGKAMEDFAQEIKVEPKVAAEVFSQVVDEAVDDNNKATVSDEVETKPQLADKIEIVNLKTTDTANSGDANNSDFGKESKQELPKSEAKVDAHTIASELTNSVNEVFTEIIGDEMITVDGTDIVRQVIDAVKVTNTNELTSMEIALNPENLGKLNLTVVAKNGSVTAQIIAENETVKRALEAQLTVLKTNLEQQGVKIDAVEVAVASHSFEGNASLEKGDQQNQQQSQSRRRSLDLSSLDDLENEELSPEELKIRQLLDDNSSVEFKA